MKKRLEELERLRNKMEGDNKGQARQREDTAGDLRLMRAGDGNTPVMLNEAQTLGHIQQRMRSHEMGILRYGATIDRKMGYSVSQSERTEIPQLPALRNVPERKAAEGNRLITPNGESAAERAIVQYNPG
ncbi:hypothetical protein TNCV_502131 [Trichonephila clavipes]|nr:hypothetical protein TNCV_502131 [Trichonephila clavipes]